MNLFDSYVHSQLNHNKLTLYNSDQYKLIKKNS